MKTIDSSELAQVNGGEGFITLHPPKGRLGFVATSAVSLAARIAGSVLVGNWAANLAHNVNQEGAARAQRQ